MKSPSLLGEAGTVHQNKVPLPKKEFHELYLHEGTIEYITPITFEDGMDWHECELYYASISNGTRERRSAFHSQRSTQIRRPSKKQLQQEVDGNLQSCLRTPYKQRKRPSHLVMRRSISFSTIPKTDGSYSRHLSDALDGMTSNGPHVNFDDYVSVSTIPLVEDYPLDVRKAIWMSRAEIDACMQGAIREDAFRRQLAQIRKRGQARHGSKVKVAVVDTLDAPVPGHDFLYLQRT
jgi:hypothetical protein